MDTYFTEINHVLLASDSYFRFAEERGYHRWAVAHSSSCYFYFQTRTVLLPLNQQHCDLPLADFSLYVKQQSRQTGSRNLMGPKTLPTIWGTYMKLVTKYQTSAIKSCWEKCDEKCAYMYHSNKCLKTIYLRKQKSVVFVAFIC
jgi:hypothetical protein